MYKIQYGMKYRVAFSETEKYVPNTYYVISPDQYVYGIYVVSNEEYMAKNMYHVDYPYSPCDYSELEDLVTRNLSGFISNPKIMFFINCNNWNYQILRKFSSNFGPLFIDDKFSWIDGVDEGSIPCYTMPLQKIKDILIGEFERIHGISTS
jgi:hypothetical protein